MATVRIGTKRANPGGRAAEPEEESRIAYTVQWIELNGTRLDSETYQIVDVTWHGGPDAHTVNIQLVSGDFSVVDETEAPYLS